MTGIEIVSSNSMDHIAQLEKKLAVSLRQTASEIARTECLDDEQRSEVYAILHALQGDHELHAQAIQAMQGVYKGHHGDA